MSDSVDTEKAPSFLKKLKIALMIFIPVLVIITFVIGIIMFQQLKEDKGNLKAHALKMLNMQRVIIANDFTEIVSDLVFFAGYHQLLDMVEGRQDLEHAVIDDFVLFSRGSGLFDQVRLLDVNGMEVIRVNSPYNNPEIVAKDRLQDKSKRYYFKDTIKLKKGQVYISPFDLNIEKGRVEIPAKPMIRFGTPIFDRKGKLRGTLIFNYLGKNLIRQIMSVVFGSPGYYMLLNNQGYWLVGRNSEEEWGFMFEDKKDLSMGRAFPDAWKKISESKSGQFESKNGLFTYATVYPMLFGWTSSTGSARANGASEKELGRNGYSWKLVSYIPREFYIRGGNDNSVRYLLIWLTHLIILAVGSWFLASALAKQKAAKG